MYIKFFISCNLTTLRFEIKKVTRVHISTKNKPDASAVYHLKDKL